MIDKISFKNYKIFKERQTLNLRPITILIGKNNSGKSAVSKLPTLLEVALNSDSSEALLLENSGVELGAELRDIVYGKSLRVLEFDLENKIDDNKSTQLSVGVVITQEKTKQVSTIVHWSLSDSIDLEDTGDKQNYIDRITGKELQCSFKGFILDEAFEKNTKSKPHSELGNEFKLNTDFIGPIRAKPLRDYRQSATSRFEKMGAEGENAYYFLIEDALTTDKKLLNEVSKWYKTNFEGWELKVNQDKAPLFQIEIHRNELKQNILDTGIGMSQVLPIVTRALKECDEDTLIIIEEPETHLHPAAHGNLASLIVESLEKGNKRYLVETHSLNFVLRLRRMVAEGKLKKEDIGIYYVDFSEKENSSTLSEIEVDDFGRVSYWPEGVFNETLDETVGIRTAQLQNKEYGS